MYVILNLGIDILRTQYYIVIADAVKKEVNKNESEDG